MAKYARVALFIDYENFYTTLSTRSQLEQHLAIPAATIDFHTLVAHIREHYGPLSQQDFIAVANFSHYDRQKGGLNQEATLIHVDSFETRQVRSQTQPSPGKKYVVKDYADMRLAFEVGQHLAKRPADLYILASGDKSFAAIGRVLRSQGVDVLFLFSFPDQAAVILKEDFPWLDFIETQKKLPPPSTNPQEPPQPQQDATPIDGLCELISILRREFSTPIPISLLKALLGAESTYKLTQSAQSQGRVDLWDDPQGVPCISRREERMFNKVVILSTRPDFVSRADLLFHISSISPKQLNEPTRAEWRRALKEHGNLNVKQAKQLLNILLEQGLLVEGDLGHLHLTLEKTIQFLKTPDIF